MRRRSICRIRSSARQDRSSSHPARNAHRWSIAHRSPRSAFSRCGRRRRYTNFPKHLISSHQGDNVVTKIREIASGLRAPEGPVALSDGSVLVVELQGGALTRVAPNGKKEVVAEVGGAPNGAAIGPDGKAYICNNGGLLFVEMSGHTLPIPGLPAKYKSGSIQRV